MQINTLNNHYLIHIVHNILEIDTQKYIPSKLSLNSIRLAYAFQFDRSLYDL